MDFFILHHAANETCNFSDWKDFGKKKKKVNKEWKHFTQLAPVVHS